MTLAFAVTYYFAPDVEQKFKFVSPGSALGVLLLIAASIAFKFYVDHFGKYNATYGSIGAVIILMLWLNITGLVILLGSEINALIEHYSPEGKVKGEKKEKQKAA
jgi:membrane protein